MIQNTTDVNNDKKFIFLSQDNAVDYRENDEISLISPSPRNQARNNLNHQTQLLNQRNNSISNSNSFNNALHHSSSHSSLSNQSSNSYINNNAYTNNNNQNNCNNFNSPQIENGKWNKDPLIYLEDRFNSNQKSPNKKPFYYDNYNDNNELSELDDVRRQIVENGRLHPESNGLMLLDEVIPKNYDDVCMMKNSSSY